jgi:hypothetical protein
LYRSSTEAMSESKDQEPAPEQGAPAAPDAAAPDAAVGAEAPSEESASAGGAAPAGADPSVDAPRKKKKKKKRKAEDEAEVEREAAITRPERDAEGRDRPRFLLKFPEDPELEELMAAFEAGNFAAVRAEAPRLIERTERPEVKRAAEELLRRIEPDPLVKFLLGVAVFLFVAVVAYVYYAHG